MNQFSQNRESIHEGTEHLTESEYHELLTAEQRRIALDILANSIPPVELADLAATVARRETDVDEGEKEAIERVALRLHHVHLPKMADLGIIDYDLTARRVESCP